MHFQSFFVWTLLLQGQTLAPVVSPRGVTNAVTQQPAPSSAAPGSLIWISGLQLGPPEGATASGLPWPTTLAGTEVLVNDRPAAIGSISPSRIVAQVPWETPNGLMAVVVRRNGATSRPGRIQVQAFRPGIRTVDDLGYGPAAGATAGRRFTFQATGLGLTEPRLANGAADGAATPRQAIRIFVGGQQVSAGIKASGKSVGEFDVSIEVPENATPGDLLILEANNQNPNRVTWGRATRAEVSFARLPAGAPELRAASFSDLRPGFFIANGARTGEGCYPSVLFDLLANRAANIAECLTTAQAIVPNATVPSINGSALAALVGPPQGDVASGVSSNAIVFQPSASEPLKVALPFNATQLGPVAGGFLALQASNPPQLATIDAVTGEVQTGVGGIVPIGGGGAGGGGGGGGGVLLNPATLQVDLGGGINKVLSLPVNQGQNRLALVVADDQADPKRAKVAIVNPQGAVQDSQDFPDGWAPLLMPAAPQGPGGGGGPGGPGGLPGGLPGGANPLAAFQRLSDYWDAPTRNYYVLARKTDDSAHALAVFSPQGVKAIALPARWFITSCTQNAQILNVETSRRIVLLGSNTADRTFRQGCGALGFVSLALDGQQIEAIALKGEGQINASARAVDINDYLLATDTTGVSVFVLDGVSGASDRIDLPQEVSAVAALTPFPDMELAVAPARARQQGAFGDAGFVVFDLFSLTSRLLQLPEGVATAQMIGILPATRKLVARGTRTGNTGSQFLIYDLTTGEVLMPANPDGVAFVGNPPAQPPAQGQPPQQQIPAIMRVNNKANSIEAITFGADRRQNGAVLIRVP